MKNMMKYFCLAVLAFAATALTSCEKDEPAYSGDGVHFSTTVKLDGSTKALDAGGHKTFAAGEQIAVIYVNNSGETVKAVSVALTDGDIASSGKVAKFSVDLDNPDKTKNVTYIYPAAMANSDGTMASIATQDGTLESLSSSLDYCTFTGAWSAGNLPANVTLTNELAVCKFTVKSYGVTDITSSITSFTVNDGSHTYTITRSAAPGPIYVAMLPVSNATISFTANNGTTFKSNVTGKSLAASNMYPITLTMSGLFTVNSSNKKVLFSRGNLRATTSNKGTSWTWAFAEHQWDKVGDAVANNCITSNKTVSTNGTVDLFGWSTSETYLGINKTNSNNDEFEGAFVDWGTHNDVKAGIGTGWYTLTGGEWYYLFGTDSEASKRRSTDSGKHFCKAKVNGVFGVILLPDDWSTTYYTLYNCDETSARNFDDANVGNIISLSDWTTYLESHGAVFLPCAGQRNSNNVVNAPNGQVHYWSATSGANTTGASANANHVKADGNGVAANTGAGRSNGFSVRLVRDAN